MSSISEAYQISEEEKSILLSWLKDNLIVTKEDSDRTNVSYIRQIFERSAKGFYLHMEVLKEILLECEIEPHDREKHNWLINISMESPMYKMQ